VIRSQVRRRKRTADTFAALARLLALSKKIYHPDITNQIFVDIGDIEFHFHAIL
jgi:hypothetical protein